jgi:asparagine synthase (glutamine-hydrolysing)
MSHRGPDGRGVWIRGGLALGHTRLAVIDRELGGQPIENEDGSIVAIVNGELYGFEAQPALEARGHRFRSRSDSELLVHLYEEHGPAVTRELRGEYAFVLWDGRTRQLIGARDPFGIKPLVYAQHGNELWMASEAKALFAAGLPAAWDPDAIRQALAHQYIGPTRTLFRGISELPPGHQLTTDGTQHHVQVAISRAPEADGEEREIVDGIRVALDDAVRVRLRADVPIAAYLSGGLDSSLVVALAARHTPITAFGIAFDHAPYDEHRDAAAFAAELGVAFHPVRVTQDAILEHLPDAVYRSEGLCINGQLSAKYLLSRAVRDAGYKVVLAGEGADEVFYGYAHLVRDYLEQAAAAGDAEAATLLAAETARDSMQAGVMLPLERRADLPVWLDAKRGIGERMRPLLSPDGVIEGDPIARLLDEVGAPPSAGVLERSATLWTKLALAKYILRTLGDGTEMAHSVEGRLPYLDARVVAAARRASPELHLRGGIAKRLLRAAARGIVPERICTREKQPLLAPPVTVFGARAADVCRDVVRGPALRAMPWFDRDRVIAWVDALATATPATARAAEPLLMTILSACALQQRFRL